MNHFTLRPVLGTHQCGRKHAGGLWASTPPSGWGGGWGSGGGTGAISIFLIVFTYQRHTLHFILRCALLRGVVLNEVSPHS